MNYIWFSRSYLPLVAVAVAGGGGNLCHLLHAHGGFLRETDMRMEKHHLLLQRSDDQ